MGRFQFNSDSLILVAQMQYIVCDVCLEIICSPAPKEKDKKEEEKISSERYHHIMSSASINQRNHTPVAAPHQHISHLRRPISLSRSTSPWCPLRHAKLLSRSCRGHQRVPWLTTICLGAERLRWRGWLGKMGGGAAVRGIRRRDGRLTATIH